MKTAQELFRSNLKRLVDRSGKSIDKIGLESDISKSTISRILAGKLNASINTLQKIADYFDIDPMDLLKP